LHPDLKFEYANNLYLKITDGTHDSPKQKGSGKHLVTSKHIKGRNIDFESAYLISVDDFNKINERSSVDQWDVIVSMIGEYCGFCYIERNSFIDYAVKNVGLYKTGSQIEAEWLYYYLTSPIGKQYLNSVKSGSSQPYLTLGGLRNLPVLVPNNQTKKERIVKVLSDIDEKIELNNKINAELEAMAKLIYDYWFVQFDFPDANGKPYKSSGGKMVYNEALKREIPDGWEVDVLGAIEPNIITGKTPSTKIPENFDGSVPFICIGDVRGNMHVTKTELTLSDVGANSQENKYIPESAICVTCIASPGLVGFATEKSQTNQQLNTVVCNQFENQYYLYFYLKDFFRFAKAKTGNTFANMNKGDFSTIKVINPKNEQLVYFAAYLKPTIEQILILTKENNKLIEIRDWLLPMLMNGQVTVKDS